MINNEIKENVNFNKLIQEKDEKIKSLEIEFLKETNIKKEYEQNIKKLNEKLLINHNDQFITSSEFYLLWNNLGTQFSYFYQNFYGYPNILFSLIHELLIIINNHIEHKIENIKEYFIQILSPGSEKINKKDLNDVLKNFLRQNLRRIFLEGKENNKNEFESVIINYSKYFINNLYQNKYNKLYKDYKKMISNQKFYDLIKLIKTIMIYIKFNDTDLIFELKDNLNRNINIQKFNNKEIIILNSKNKKEKINGILLLKPPLLKNGYTLRNNLLPLILDIKNQKLKNLKEEIEEYEKETIIYVDNKNNFNDNSYKNKYNNYHKINLNLLIRNKNHVKNKLLKYLKISNLFFSNKKDDFLEKINKIKNNTISDRKRNPSFFLTHSNNNINERKINRSFNLKDKNILLQSYIRFKKKIFNIEDTESNNHKKKKFEIINKQILNDIKSQGDNSTIIKLIKKPNILLKNIDLPKEKKKIKIDDNSATETTVEYSSYSYNQKKNYNLVGIHPKNNLISNNNYIYQNICSIRCKKINISNEKNNSKNNSYVNFNNSNKNSNSDFYFKEIKYKNIMNNQIKLLETVIKKNKRPNSQAKTRFHNLNNC